MKKICEFASENKGRIVSSALLGGLCLHYGAEGLGFLLICAIVGIWCN